MLGNINSNYRYHGKLRREANNLQIKINRASLGFNLVKGVNGGSLGLNLGNGYSNKAWVDQASSIIATNSVNIDVANDTNITGALIANQNNQGIYIMD